MSCWDLRYREQFPGPANVLQVATTPWPAQCYPDRLLTVSLMFMIVATQSKGLWFGMSSNVYRLEEALYGLFQRMPTRVVMPTVQVSACKGLPQYQDTLRARDTKLACLGREVCINESDCGAHGSCACRYLGPSILERGDLGGQPSSRTSLKDRFTVSPTPTEGRSLGEVPCQGQLRSVWGSTDVCWEDTCNGRF